MSTKKRVDAGEKKARGHETAHPPEVKAQTVAHLLAGLTVPEVARDMKLPETTVLEWKRELPPDALAQLITNNSARFEGLIYDYLAVLLQALARQAEHAADEAYCKTLSGADLATLHGVLADRAFALLSALEAALQKKKVADARATAGQPPQNDLSENARSVT